jgi:membrane protein DedA with SNARE-associated domain
VTFSLIGTIVDVIVFILATIGLPGLYALTTVESFGIPPIPSEIILPFAGFLIVDGTFPLVPTIVVAIAGEVTGAFIAYTAGRLWRPRLAGLGVGYIRIRPDHLDRMDRMFARRGEVTVVVGRLIPVVRSYVSYPAGTARMNPVKFGLYTLVGSAPWTLGLLYAGIVLRSRWTVVVQYFQPIDTAIVVLIVVGAIYLSLVAGGVVTSGWPPRRGPRYSRNDGVRTGEPPAGPNPPADL